MSKQRNAEYHGMNSAILPLRGNAREEGDLPEEMEDILISNRNQKESVSAVVILDSGGRRHLVIRKSDAGFSEVGTEIA